jgi:transcriptional regulator with XRE-family HTH domain
VAKREGIAERLRRLRLERGMSQRDLSSPGVSYAYISRIEAGARTPSVKAMRLLAQKLGVTVEHLETGERTPLEQGVALAGLDYETLTPKELRKVRPTTARARLLGAPPKKWSKSDARPNSPSSGSESTSLAADRPCWI